MKLPLLRSLLMYDGVLRQYFETQIRVATDQSFHSSENCSWGTLARAKAHKGTSTDGAAASSTTTQSQATTSSTQTNAVSGRQEISMHTSCSSSSTSSSFSYPISKGSSASSSSCAPGVHANVLPFVTRTEYISGDELGLDRGRFWEETLHKLNDAVDPFFVIISYSRQAVGQKHFSGGHVAPLGGYDPGTDRVLVLEVNSWRYPSCWIPAELLYQGIQTQTSVGIPRGMLKVFYDPKRGRGAAAGKMD
ncbi:unnamed protein product [Amoebophrya sp. A25]|nr:unnamed protein product [Amoebophrya sp. A25]|eukprot:GSA25T00005364001.1